MSVLRVLPQETSCELNPSSDTYTGGTRVCSRQAAVGIELYKLVAQEKRRLGQPRLNRENARVRNREKVLMQATRCARPG